MLVFQDVEDVASLVQGLSIKDLMFEHVSITFHKEMRKGLYFPLNEEMNVLKAIDQGAIAAIIPVGCHNPKNTPNHFPIFTAEHPVKTYQQLLQNYYKKTKQEKWETMTKFTFYDESIQKPSFESLDITQNNHYNTIMALLNKGLNDKGGN